MARKKTDRIIEGHDLSFHYTVYDSEGNPGERRTALDGVDIDVQQGQFVAILGHNGSGKSTLARHLNALLVPDGGTLYVDGYDTLDAGNVWKIRQSTGMVFQNPDNQIIASVVEEDVGFGLENQGVPTADIWKRVEEALRAVGMWKMRGRSPNRLSGGQKQRVAIAGVIAMHPKCIVLDEATAMLDPGGRKEVIRTVRELNRTENVTVILITHYMEEAVFADRVIVMDHGKVVMGGTPREIFSQVEKLKSFRLDVPQATLLAWKLKQRGLPIKDTVLTIDELIEALNHGAAENDLTQPVSR
jgi:energy-coupling factor transport system ATP-binding protein